MASPIEAMSFSSPIDEYLYCAWQFVHNLEWFYHMPTDALSELIEALRDSISIAESCVWVDDSYLDY